MVHSRKIDWFFDAAGGGGKSRLAKYLAWNFPKKVCVIPTFKAWDILKLAAMQPNRQLYIINLAKSKPKDISKEELYNAIEGIKDGFYCDTKGANVKSVFARIPMVWVFTNHMASRDCMAQKRFTIRKVPPMPASFVEEEDEFDFGECCPMMSEAEMAGAEYDFCLE